jgi:hypothetical protein
VLIWVDCGNDLANSLKGPWSKNPLETQLHPVINYRPNDALKADVIDNQKALVQSSSMDSAAQFQNAVLLQENYGETLRSELTACDALYALNEVLSFSEAQFLNLVDSKLRMHMEDEKTQEFNSLPNLIFMRQILYRHIQCLQENINTICNKKTYRLWPTPTNCVSLRGISEAAAESILGDFTHNLEHARRLDTRCHEAISILMSTSSIAESKKAMAQQERVGKLTFLAFLFVPLPFTTSFFSMNFPELDKDGRSIWQWAVGGYYSTSFLCQDREFSKGV